jgi:hypothetical protein
MTWLWSSLSLGSLATLGGGRLGWAPRRRQVVSTVAFACRRTNCAKRTHRGGSWSSLPRVLGLRDERPMSRWAIGFGRRAAGPGSGAVPDTARSCAQLTVHAHHLDLCGAGGLECRSDEPWRARRVDTAAPVRGCIHPSLATAYQARVSLVAAASARAKQGLGSNQAGPELTPEPIRGRGKLNESLGAPGSPPSQTSAAAGVPLVTGSRHATHAPQGRSMQTMVSGRKRSPHIAHRSAVRASRYAAGGRGFGERPGRAEA